MLSRVKIREGKGGEGEGKSREGERKGRREDDGCM